VKGILVDPVAKSVEAIVREGGFTPPLERLICGDCRDVLPTLEVGSVQCCVTSPPYWGLRDYGTAQWEGGGCALESLHQLSEQGVCLICGARRIDAQLGLEATPEEYIAKMVAVFREVWRVLRDDGTLWVNMGDSYGQNQGNGFDTHEKIQVGTLEQREKWRARKAVSASPKVKTGLKPKDLCMMPARLAMALQADGWYLRSDIIWHKPNPMPESVTDRPTKSHEYIFLLTKSERYFYDAEAIREPSVDTWNSATSTLAANGIKNVQLNQMGQRRTAGADTFHRDDDRTGRNKRSVWTIPTQPYAEAHFATFPEEIPKLCILAGSKPGDTVLDPFAGSGTTGQVALELGRKVILIELNPEYMRLARARTWVTPGFF
jgi:DNA modification methylase